MKIKICCVDEDGRYGGPQSRMIDIYKKLDKKKFDYFFLIPNNINILKKKLIKINANFNEIEITRLSKDFFMAIKYVIFFPLEILTLSKFFEEKKFNLIQANGVPHFKTIIAAKISKIPSLWIIEDSYSPKIVVIIFRFLAKIFDSKIIYISKKVYSFYLHNLNINKNNIYKVMSPVDTSFYKKKKTFKKKKNLIITSVSGIISVKDTETFLHVANKVISRNKNVQFIIAGRGTKNESRYYKKIINIYNSFNINIRKKIKFIGMSSNVRRLLDNSDIFLCTSKSEGGPIVVWEAMSMLLPVVSTKVGGTSEYIKDGYSGFLCDVGDADGLSKKITILINNYDIRKNFALRSRKIALKLLNSVIIAKKYQKIYERVHRKLQIK